jgi:hypothetical protein
MFETSKEMQLGCYLNNSPAGRLQWHSITQTLLIRWFHIRYLCEDSLAERVLMTGDLEVLESINSDSSFQVIAVHLASPPDINGTNNWALSPLYRITTLFRTRPDFQELLGFEYYVDGGKVFFEPFSSSVSPKDIEIERADLFIRRNPLTPKPTPH